ncbi:hypothetical protein D3C86_1924260 [compost metagenome]
MPEVTALQSFDHNGRRRRGERFPVSDGHAAALVRAGLVSMAAPDDPGQAAGGKPSASPAAPASPEQTSKPSARGAKPKKAAP